VSGNPLSAKSFSRSELGGRPRISENPALNSPPLASSPALETTALPRAAVADRQVHHVKRWHRWALSPLTGALNLWLATLRLDASPATLRAIESRAQPIAFILWHNRLFFVPRIFRVFRRRKEIYALISASKDGAWLADFFALIGMRSVRGSSSRLGREAASALVDELRAGHDVGITPDGPRGPRYDFKSGGLIVARRAKAPIVLVGIIYESAWQLSSWDRFYLPKPFSRARLVARMIDLQESKSDGDGAEQIKNLLVQINPDLQETVNVTLI
jgi:lysophospholipid acyltransferase (LPLAT)-like uncharacterized protein